MSDEIKTRTVYVLTRTNKTEDDDSDIYVGSTSQPLPQRLARHMYSAKNFIGLGFSEDSRLYVRMNEVGLGNWEILPLLSRTCGIKTIREIEKKWVRVLNAYLNSISPIRDEETMKEYWKNHNAMYYKDNKETILQRQTAYNEKHKGVKKEYDTAYYENNKKAILQKKAVRDGRVREERRFYCSVCELACVSKRDLDRHLDTRKHSYAWLNSLD